MKRLLIFLILVVIPFVLHANTEDSRFWFCRQNGHVDDNLTMVISDVWQDNYPNHYEDREDAFSAHIRDITDQKFIPSFQAKCRDYNLEEYAEKHRGIEIKTAKKYNAIILELEWRWNPSVRN